MPSSPGTMVPSHPNLRPQATSPSLVSTIKILLVLIAQLPLLHASPLRFRAWAAEEEPMPAHEPTLWIYLAVAIALVLLGGAFAGLTIALMGQDEIYLQVIKTSGEGSEKKHAAKVLRLLNRGKHWVLVTLLLGNVITNETLPIVLDRSLGGGWPAVLGSTVLIVIFGEIIPQSICVRYGLPIGAWMSPLVLVLMYVLAPVAWPTAKLLDRILGEDHGTTYKKAGLKTLVTLHKSLGAAGEQLNEDEVKIISAVLDLKAKPVGNIMTPMDDVFTMSADTVLDEKTMELILGAGYSRIPIYAPDNDQNYVGMLLVKILITYDPEDCKRVREFALATLPETRPETSCLDIINFFQEGKSHMVLVSEDPGKDHGAVGVVTLEDVIEELIGEEIIDESDVYVDVHKAIRRNYPAPKSKVPKGEVVTDIDDSLAVENEPLIDINNDKDPHEALQRRLTVDGHGDKPNSTGTGLAASPRPRGDLSRRKSSGFQATSEHESIHPKPPMSAEMRKRFEHLGPSNLASRPKATRINTVKVKRAPGSSNAEESNAKPPDASTTPRGSFAAQGGVGAGLVSSAGKDAKDGVLAVQAGYGSIPTSTPPTSPKQTKKDRLAPPTDNQHHRPSSHSRTDSQSTVGSMHSGMKSPVSRSRSHRGTARSGSITENIIDAGGFKKTVLEMTSSSEDPEGSNGANGKDRKNGGERSEDDEGGKENERHDGTSGGKKKRRRRKRKDGGENEPLLGSR